MRHFCIIKRIALACIMSALLACAPAQERPAWPMPSIPASLTAPEDRADYLALHFWQPQRPAAIDPSVLEQAFVDFLSVLPLTSAPAVTDAAIDSLVTHTADIMADIAPLAVKYLYETDSPMLNEGLYARYLQCRLLDDALTVAESSRITLALEDIARNKPGTPAPDIRLRLADGQGASGSASLLDLADGLPAIVLFYDHDCDQCQETLDEMFADSRLTSKLGSGALRLIAVDVDLMDDHKIKRQTPNWYWTSAVDDVEDCFAIRSFPSIYVLSADGTILIKDSGYSLVSAAIFHE